MKKWIHFASAGLLALCLVSCQSAGSGQQGGASENGASAGTEAQVGAEGQPSGEAEAKDKGEGDAVQETDASAETKVEAGVQIPNPMEEAEDGESLEAIGLSMAVPEDASDVEYYVISDVVGQMSFVWEDHVFTCRGSATAEDFAGIFEEFEETETVFDAEGTDEGVRVRSTVSGGRLADWSIDGVKYTLYTPDSVEEEIMEGLCLEISGISSETEPLAEGEGE